MIHSAATRVCEAWVQGVRWCILGGDLASQLVAPAGTCHLLQTSTMQLLPRQLEDQPTTTYDYTTIMHPVSSDSPALASTTCHHQSSLQGAYRSIFALHEAHCCRPVAMQLWLPFCAFAIAGFPAGISPAACLWVTVCWLVGLLVDF